jgi:hypothetical protein
VPIDLPWSLFVRNLPRFSKIAESLGFISVIKLRPKIRVSAVVG